jgi:hypothetical protein
MNDKAETLGAIIISGAAGQKTENKISEHLQRSGRGDLSRLWSPAKLRWRRKDDDDDDPPPCPAVIAPFPRLPPLGAEAALEAA